MADGSIKFDTKVNEKGFKEGISSLNKALDRFVKRTGEVGKAIDQNFNTSKKAADLEREIQQTEEKIKNLTDAMKKSEEIKVPTNEYKELEKQAEKAGQKLETLLNRQEKMEALGKNHGSQAWKSLSYDIEQASEKYDTLAAKMENMEKDGTAFQAAKETETYKKQEAELESLNAKLYELKQSLIEAEAAEIQAAVAAKAQTERTEEQKQKIEKVKKTALNAANAFVKFSKSLLGMNRTAKKSNKVLSRLKSMFLFSAIRKAISGITNAFKEGIQNLAQYSDSANRSMSELSSGSMYLKNSFAAAFAPILSVVVPVLSTLIGYIATATNYVNQFFAALGGGRTYTKAVKTTEDYAASLKKTGSAAKEAEKTLAPFDDLVQMQTKNTSSSGGSSGTDPSSMFTEEMISENVSGFADKIKELVADGDWSGVGQTIGEKVNEAMDSIDYSGIGKKIGFGINASVLTAYGFLDTVSFKKIGMHIAELLNSSLSEIDFYTLGGVIGKGFTIFPDILIGFLLELDWGLVASSFCLCLMGIFDEGTKWLNSYDWSNVGMILWQKLKDMFSSIDYGGLASSFFTFLGTALRAAILLLGSFFGNIGADIKTWWDNEIKGQSWEETASNLLNAIGKGFLNIGTWAIEHIAAPFCMALLRVDTWEDVVKIGKDIWDGFCKGIKEFFNNPIGFIKEHITDPFINGVKGLLGIHSPSTVLAEIGSNTVAGFNEGVTAEQMQSQNVIRSWAEGIKNWFSSKFGISDSDAAESKKWAASIMSGFNTTVKSKYKQSQGGMEKWAESARIWFVGTNDSKGVNEASWKKFAENIIQSFMAAISSGQEASKAPMENWSDHVREWFWGDCDQNGTGGMYAAFYNMAKRINEGFANGISDFAYMAKAAIRQWAAEIMEEAEEEFDIHSPSREFYAIAEYVVKGFNEGITDMISTSKSAAEQWLDRIFDVFDGADISLPVGLDLPDAAAYIPHIAAGSVVPPRAGEASTAMRSSAEDQTEVLSVLLLKLDELIAQLKNNGNQPVEIVMNLSGNLASLARVLKPELDKEAKRKGVSLVIVGGA